jgi:hypothetical protein
MPNTEVGMAKTSRTGRMVDGSVYVAVSVTRISAAVLRFGNLHGAGQPMILQNDSRQFVPLFFVGIEG